MNLTALPTEILLKIFNAKNLSADDMLMLREVDRDLYKLATEALFKRDDMIAYFYKKGLMDFESSKSKTSSTQLDLSPSIKAAYLQNPLLDLTEKVTFLIKTAHSSQIKLSIDEKLLNEILLKLVDENTESVAEDTIELLMPVLDAEQALKVIEALISNLVRLPRYTIRELGYNDLLPPLLKKLSAHEASRIFSEICRIAQTSSKKFTYIIGVLNNWPYDPNQPPLTEKQLNENVAAYTQLCTHQQDKVRNKAMRMLYYLLNWLSDAQREATVQLLEERLHDADETNRNLAFNFIAHFKMHSYLHKKIKSEADFTQVLEMINGYLHHEQLMMRKIGLKMVSLLSKDEYAQQHKETLLQIIFEHVENEALEDVALGALKEVNDEIKLTPTQLQAFYPLMLRKLGSEHMVQQAAGLVLLDDFVCLKPTEGEVQTVLTALGGLPRLIERLSEPDAYVIAAIVEWFASKLSPAALAPYVQPIVDKLKTQQAVSVPEIIALQYAPPTLTADDAYSIFQESLRQDNVKALYNKISNKTLLLLAVIAPSLSTDGITDTIEKLFHADSPCFDNLSLEPSASEIPLIRCIDRLDQSQLKQLIKVELHFGLSNKMPLLRALLDRVENVSEIFNHLIYELKTNTDYSPTENNLLKLTLMLPRLSELQIEEVISFVLSQSGKELIPNSQLTSLLTSLLFADKCQPDQLTQMKSMQGPFCQLITTLAGWLATFKLLEKVEQQPGLSEIQRSALRIFIKSGDIVALKKTIALSELLDQRLYLDKAICKRLLAAELAHKVATFPRTERYNLHFFKEVRALQALQRYANCTADTKALDPFQDTFKSPDLNPFYQRLKRH